MRKNVLSCVVFFTIALCPLVLWSQAPQGAMPKVPVRKGPPLPKDENGKAISGDMYFKYGNFDLALSIYLEDLKKKPTDADINFKIGVCYLETNINKKAAIDFLESAQRNGYKENDIVIRLGQALMHAEKFDEAIKKFEEYKSLEFKNSQNVSEADKFIGFCNVGKQLKAKPLNVTIENLGSSVNSPKTDNMPFIDPNESFLIFNTNRTYAAEFTEYIWDILTANYKFGKWKKAKSISNKINSSDNEFIGGASPNLENLVIRPDTYDHSGDLLISHSNNKKFDIPDKLNANINSEPTFESSGCVTASGDTLYFATDKPGGFGGTDIYYSLRIGNEWGIAQNLGPTINTPYNDDYPNISMDGKTLYFASEGHNSMGGYDVFVSKFNAINEEWSKPQNIGYPLNSTYDDYNISFSSSPRYAYIAAVREGGLGEYDIYKVIFNNVEQPYVTYTGKVAVGDTASSTPLNQLSNNVSVKLYDTRTNELYGEYTLNKSSRYVVALPPGVFKFVIIADGETKLERMFTIYDKQPDVPVIIEDMYIKGPDTAPKPKSKPAAKPAGKK